MKKHLAKSPLVVHALQALLFTLVILLIGSTLPSATVLAEKDSSVTDYIKENKEQKNSPDSEEKKLPEQEQEQEDNSAVVVGLSAWDYIKTGLALLFVIGLIYGMVKLINTRNRVTQHGKIMQNMGGLSLGQQKSIQLVKIGERFYLVGVGEDVRLLKEVTDPEELTQMTEYYSDDNDETIQSPILKLINGLKSKKVNPYQKQNEPEDFGSLFKDKLTEIESERKRQLNRLTEKERNRDE